MKSKTLFNLKKKRILLYASRGSLRFVNSWQMDPLIICLLFTAIFGTLGAIGTFIVYKKVSYTILSGILSVIGNGLIMGSACMGKKTILEIHQALLTTDQEIKLITHQRKITQEDRRLHLDNLRKEKEAENLRIKKERLEASEQIKKDELAKNHEENKKLQKQLVNIENLRLNKLKFSSSNHNSKLCWHCKQKLFPEWNQCVYCRMIA
jgi:hypothetical protein